MAATSSNPLITEKISDRLLAMNTRRAIRIVLWIIVIAVPLVLATMAHVRPESGRGVRGTIQTIFSPFVRVLSWAAEGTADGLETLVTSGQVRRRNHFLEEEVVRQRAENQYLRQAIAKYERLGGMQSLAETRNWTFTTADCIAFGDRRWSHGATIDRGFKNGLREGDTVLHASGLAGMVESAGPWTATVQFLSHPQAAVGVMVLPQRVPAVVRGTGDNDILEMILEDPSVPIDVGQEVVTSGIEGSLYPSGIRVGTIGLVSRNRFGQSIAQVIPIADFRRIEDVLVLVNNNPSKGETGVDETTTDSLIATPTANTSATTEGLMALPEVRMPEGD
jgi:rod shape-determining protein MreC